MRTISQRYALDREVGRGAAGSVWRARDQHLQRSVAIKVMRPDCLASPAFRTRFEREALTIAQVKSPYVVQVYDAGFDDGEPFIVMEWLEGESLDEWLHRNGRGAPSFAVDLVVQLARGLALTYAAGVIHRDVKPANIFLAREHDRTVPKLLDFGVATLLTGLATPATPLNAVAGTPQYMSPEQISGREVDGRSDLWSLAVVAYRVLTGMLPFQSDGLEDLRTRICAQEHLPPSRHNPELSPLVDQFFTTALAKDRKARFQTANDLAAAFLRACEKQAPNPIRILLLDDEPDMELLFRNRFRREIREGMYELLFATDGNAGLNLLRARPDIDVVLTDINMPGMDGLTFLAHAAKVNPLVKVVVVSAYNDMANLRMAMNRGAFDFLVKPIDFDDLQTTIEKSASQLAILRQAARSQQENGLLRMLVGRSQTQGTLETHAPTGRLDGTIGFLTLDCRDGGSLTDVPIAVDELGEIFQGITEVLLDQQPTLVRLVGGSLMVVFSGANHAHRALEGCLAARERVRGFGERGLANGKAGLRLTTGLDSGALMMGQIGKPTEGRLETIVLGEPVNRAFALQTAATGTHDLLVSARLDESLDDSFVRLSPDPGHAAGMSIRAVAVVGKSTGAPAPVGDRLSSPAASTQPRLLG
jgi:serine/threonine protein kinase/class 3 adenylate cyclase